MSTSHQTKPRWMPWILPNVKKQATSEPPCFGGVFELKPPINQRTHTRKKVRWVTWVIWPKIIRAAGGAGAGSARLIGWSRPLIAGVETADKLIRLLIMNSRSTMPHTMPPPGGTTLCLKQTKFGKESGKSFSQLWKHNFDYRWTVSNLFNYFHLDFHPFFQHEITKSILNSW